MHATFSSGGPRPEGGPAAWDSESLQRRPQWHIELSGSALDELLALSERTVATRGNLRDLQPASQVLQRLYSELALARNELLNGSGVVLIRGLPIGNLLPAVRERLYWLLGTGLGNGLAQNLKGDLLGDVINLSDRQESARPFQNGGGLIMHRDPVDIVGLLCVRHAKSGGQSRIVSAVRIHDELAHMRPDLLARLYEGYVYHRLEEDRGDAQEFTRGRLPVFERDERGAVSCFFIPGPIQRAGKLHESIDARGMEALQHFVELTEAPALYYDMALEPGDVQFLNNRLVLHGRTDYEDYPDLERRRYMLRLWLAQPEWPSMNPRQQYFERYDHFDHQASRMH